MKPTRHFVICLIAFSFFSLSSITCYANEAVDMPFHRTDTPNQSRGQKAPFWIPLTAEYSSDTVSFIFCRFCHYYYN